MAKDWKDIFMDEDAPEQPKVDLPDDNEEKGEETPAGAEAAGALSEDGNDEGIKDVPAGEDEITGTKSTEYDDVFHFLDEDAPEAPKVDLPDENEEAGEETPAGAEAAGALSEDGDDPGIKDVPQGEDEITGTKSTEYDDRFSFLNEDAEGKGEEEKPAEEGGEEAPAEGEGEGDDKGGESQDCRNKKRKAGKKRRNAWSFFDEEEGAGEAPAEGGEEAPAEGGEEQPAEGEGEAKEAENKKRKAGKKRRNEWSIFDEDGEGAAPSEEQPEDNDEAEGDEDKPESKEAENKKKKASKKRRNEWSIFDEDEEGGEEESKEGEEKPAEEGEEKPAEESEEKKEDKKRGSKKRRRNEFSFFDEDGEGEGEGEKEEGSDDDGASEKEPTKAPEGEGEKEEEKPAEDSWSSFFDDGNVEEPENVPGDAESVEPVDGQGKKVDPIGDPQPNTELTEPILLPVETEDGEQKQFTNRKSPAHDRYFFN